MELIMLVILGEVVLGILLGYQIGLRDGKNRLMGGGK